MGDSAMETCFPLEIWEVILQCLPFPDLLRAACVCYQWRHLARRICRLRCQYLPQRLLLELAYECSITTTTTTTTTTTHHHRHHQSIPTHITTTFNPPCNYSPTNNTCKLYDSLSSSSSSNLPTNSSSHNSPHSSNTNHSSSSSSSSSHITPPDTRPPPVPACDTPVLRPSASTSQLTSQQMSQAPISPCYLNTNTSTTNPRPREDINLAECPDEEDTVDWLQVTKMLLQTRLTSRPQDCSVIRQAKGVLLLASSGGFLVLVERVGDGEGVVRVLGEEGRECHYALPGTINKVCVLEGGSDPPLVALSVERELRCLLVGPRLESLTPLPLTPRLTVDSRLCCEGRTLLVSQLNEDYNLSVFRVNVVGMGVGVGVEGASAELTLLARITTATSPLLWDLWNGFVTTLVSSGHVLTYTLMGSLVGESPLYKDLRYPNPTLLSRGLVFSSTMTSRALLSYWHMDRDRDFWLLGESVLTSWVHRGAGAVGNASCRKDNNTTSQQRNDRVAEVDKDSNSPRGYMEPSSSCMLSLAKVRVGAAVLQEVTVIHYRRGLVFCGTSQGHLLVYKILHEEGGLNNNIRFTDGRDGVASERRQGSSSAGEHRQLSSLSGRHNERINWGVMECCLPSLCLALAHRPVSRLTSHFALSSVIVAVADRDGNCQIVTIPYTDIL
ncbi:hypothetical protein Pmani_029611 [Petrolisthes manimaculis]|uniref:F-box domain-containing protein n=1 Tax=Petrolisthes manimaculis TaxID=1843537 RepID=A0AAE1NX81_9EUCA|nr:hypothetical protein Pmani_029611 [Petrolisthes manimaculis]